MADEDYNQPYVGYRQVRRPEAQNDRIASANAPLSALRGYIAGTLGLPGNLEGLGRMLIPGVSNRPYLPNSEYFQNVLPLRSLQETPTGRVFTEAGDLFGGAGLSTGARIAGSGAKALGRATAEQIVKGVESGNPMFAAVAPMNVVKPKGGNWLAGQSERVVDPMKTRVVGRDPAAQLRDLDASYAQNLEAGTAMNEGAFARERARLEPDIAMNRWLDTKLGKYMRNEMATPEDPLRALAERGITHAEVAPLNTYLGDTMALRRESAGFPGEGLGQSEAAQRWEAAADYALHNLPAKNRLTTQRLEAENPWLLKVPPETMTYGAYSDSGGALGFPHLADELRNAINPESGLPAALRLKYQDLEKVTVPQAVERVAKINEWRAAQKAEADTARAMNPATQVVKEYPEQGFKWVELRQPKETVSLTDDQLRSLMQDRDMSPEEISSVLRDPEMRTQIEKMAGDDYGPLADALKYEGETMGHCVGGYCPDVVEGRSKIFSLRDKKGQPHVTIEVAPGPRIFDTGTPDGRPGPENIVQIKGKGNKAPKEDYLPAVQDFVRSGNFGSVGDLKNAGLYRKSDFIDEFKPEQLDAIGQGEYLTFDEIKKLREEKNWKPIDTDPDLDIDITGFSHGGQVRGYAEGGEVSGANFPTDDFDPDRIDAIVGELHAMNAA